MASVLRLFAALTFIFWTAPATADTWLPPSTEIYFSPDKKVRLTVIPHPSTQWEFAAEEEAEQQLPKEDDSSEQANPRGLLERMSDTGGWTVVWDRPLLNEVAPTNALVASSGRYVVTFDNWYAQGLGENAVVIYGPDGSVIRSFRLEDFLPADYVRALPHTAVGAIDWQCYDRHRISTDEQTLILKVEVPNWGAVRRKCVDVAIDLATGQPSPPRGKAWQRALLKASRIAVPDTSKTADWYGYLEIVHRRIDPDWQAEFPTKRVLFPPEDPDYADSEARLRDALLEKLHSNAVMIASPASPDNLLRVLTEIGREAAPGAFKQRRIYVLVAKAYHERVTAALAPTGATIIPLDPAQSIPQWKERLDRHEAFK